MSYPKHEEVLSLRSFDSWLDRFCAKHRNLAVPNLMLYIVIGNVIVFVLDMFSRYSFSHMLTFVPYYIFHGQIWRLVTFIFVPEGSNLLFVAISLYFYYFIGNALEREWGSARFTVFYGIGVLVNIAVGLVLSFLYGLNYPWPVVRWLAWIDAAFFAWSILSSLFHLNWVGVVLPVVAILNFLLFFSSDAARIFGRVRHRTSRQTINFKKATKEAKKDKGYLHKCAVCGITDADDPNMEFRYCSKCSGYYCYCMDHINNHVHIQ